MKTEIVRMDKNITCPLQATEVLRLRGQKWRGRKTCTMQTVTKREQGRLYWLSDKIYFKPKAFKEQRTTLHINKRLKRAIRYNYK